MIEIGQQSSVRNIWEQQVKTFPEKEFLIYENPDTGEVKTFTYAAFDKLIAQAANLFLARNVRAGDRVGVQLHNSVELVLCLMGLSCIGAVFVPMNCTFTIRECKDIIDRCGITLFVSYKDMTDKLRRSCSNLDCISVGADDESKFLKLCRNESTCVSIPDDITGDEIIEIMHTSGTTASPKGVMLTHNNFIFAGRYVNWELAMNPSDRYLSTMDASHVNFQLSALMPVISIGATLIFIRRYSASRFWDEAKKYDATLVQGMSMIVRTLLAQKKREDDAVHTIREMHYFLPITENEKKAFESRFGVTLLNNYGSTEDLVGCITDYPDGERRWPSIGRAGPGYEARIIDDSGNEAGPNVLGQIAIHGKPGVSLMAGYWNEPEATSEAVSPDGWFFTGDYGYRDADGWYYFTDRASDLIKRSGENISANEVQSVIMDCPGVYDVAVFGVPDDMRDEAVKAVIVAEKGASIDVEDIISYASTKLAYYKVPTIIEFSDSLPRGLYGKILKHELREDHINQQQFR